MTTATSDLTAIDFFNSRAAAYVNTYNRNPDVHERMRVWQNAIDRFVRREMNVLDLGCGDGIFSFYAHDQGATVHGVDGSSEMIKRCEDNARDRSAWRATFDQAVIPFEQPEWRQSFDVVMSSSVLEYIADIDTAIRQIGEWTRPGGVALVSLPNWQSFYRKCERLVNRCIGPISYFAFVENYLSVEEISDRFDAAGFDRLSVQYYASNNRLSRCAKFFGLDDQWRGNLYLSVFRKRA